MVLHVARNRGQHVGIALDQRPMHVAKMVKEFRPGHCRAAPTRDDHLQHGRPPCIRCSVGRPTVEAPPLDEIHWSYELYSVTRLRTPNGDGPNADAARLRMMLRNQAKPGSSSS